MAYDDSGKPVGAAVNNSCSKEEMALTMEEAIQGVEDPRSVLNEEITSWHPALFGCEQRLAKQPKYYDLLLG